MANWFLNQTCEKTAEGLPDDEAMFLIKSSSKIHYHKRSGYLNLAPLTMDHNKSNIVHVRKILSWTGLSSFIHIHYPNHELQFTAVN